MSNHLTDNIYVHGFEDDVDFFLDYGQATEQQGLSFEHPIEHHCDAFVAIVCKITEKCFLWDLSNEQMFSKSRHFIQHVHYYREVNDQADTIWQRQIFG